MKKTRVKLVKFQSSVRVGRSELSYVADSPLSPNTSRYLAEADFETRTMSISGVLDGETTIVPFENCQSWLNYYAENKASSLEAGSNSPAGNPSTDGQGQGNS